VTSVGEMECDRVIPWSLVGQLFVNSRYRALVSSLFGILLQRPECCRVIDERVISRLVLARFKQCVSDWDCVAEAWKPRIAKPLSATDLQVASSTGFPSATRLHKEIFGDAKERADRRPTANKSGRAAPGRTDAILSREIFIGRGFERYLPTLR
jgi:hypothetical protein